MIIDSHMHCGDVPFPFGIEYGIGDLAAVFEANRVDAGMVFCHDNDLTRKVLEEIPQAHGFYWADPHRPGWLEEAGEWLAESRVKGVKLHPLTGGFHPADPALDPLMRMLAVAGKPVLYHTGHAIFSEPWQVAQMARRHPETVFIFGHMGHGNAFYIEDAIEAARQLPGVYLETSGCALPHKIAAAEAELPGRVLFGSDVPCHPWGHEAARVELSGLDEAGIAAVMGGNAARLFFPAGLPS